MGGGLEGSRPLGGRREAIVVVVRRRGGSCTRSRGRRCWW